MNLPFLDFTFSLYGVVRPLMVLPSPFEFDKSVTWNKSKAVFLSEVTVIVISLSSLFVNEEMAAIVKIKRRIKLTFFMFFGLKFYKYHLCFYDYFRKIVSFNKF